MTFFRHSLEISRFSPLFSILTLTNLQLLTTANYIYNSRHCDQLHVKVCPVTSCSSLKSRRVLRSSSQAVMLSRDELENLETVLSHYAGPHDSKSYTCETYHAY